MLDCGGGLLKTVKRAFRMILKIPMIRFSETENTAQNKCCDVDKGDCND